MSAEALYRSYTMFGDDPYIITDEEGVPFSAWEYAKARASEISQEASISV